jgi:hypothetical protein
LEILWYFEGILVITIYHIENLISPKSGIKVRKNIFHSSMLMLGHTSLEKGSFYGAL